MTTWFLTDGEETVFINQKKQPEHIPTDRKDKQFNFFNLEQENGMTQYQESLCEKIKKVAMSLADQNCQLEFHICHLGEAHPIFLKTLREAVAGDPILFFG